MIDTGFRCVERKSLNIEPRTVMRADLLDKDIKVLEHFQCDVRSFDDDEAISKINYELDVELDVEE